jgi:hypothetical protein
MTREIPTFIISFAEREVDRNLKESGMRSPAAVPQWRNDRVVEFLMCEVFVFIIFYLFLWKILSGVVKVISISGKESSEGSARYRCDPGKSPLRLFKSTLTSNEFSSAIARSKALSSLNRPTATSIGVKPTM